LLENRISRGLRFNQPPPNQDFGLSPALTAFGNPGVYSSIIPSPQKSRFGPNPALRACFCTSHPRALLIIASTIKNLVFLIINSMSTIEILRISKYQQYVNHQKTKYRLVHLVLHWYLLYWEDPWNPKGRPCRAFAENIITNIFTERMVSTFFIRWKSGPRPHSSPLEVVTVCFRVPPTGSAPPPLFLPCP